MFIRKLNSICVFKYPFDTGKAIVCLATADSISVSVLPTAWRYSSAHVNYLEPKIGENIIQILCKVFFSNILCEKL